MIKEIPKYERPREKLLREGVSNLSNIELLAVIIKSGIKGKSALELSEEILYSINSLKELKDLELQEITNIKGVGLVKAMEIICAIELGKRISNERKINKKLKSPKEIYEAYKGYLDYKTEHFIAIYLDSKCNVITMKEICSGDVNTIRLSPNEIFRYAIKIGSSSVVVMHNHPTGDPTPSNADIEYTEKLQVMANAINVLLLDHIIVGNTYYSFADNGLL